MIGAALLRPHLKDTYFSNGVGILQRGGGSSLNRQSGFVRTLTASAAIAIAVALAGCQTNQLAQIPSKAMQPLSRDMIARLSQKSMPVESPILVRVFKEESELEVWKQDTSGRFALLKTYPICRWSGKLGPKRKQGDRQAPEGFYSVGPGQMNPNSKYYLAFNLGFPNAFDKAHGRTGAFLMVHGDCSSSGCYSMTDNQMAEIYALGREAFLGGQNSFQVQAFPFRMTPVNMAKHRNNPNFAFWRMLKQGNDHFEVTRLEPKVDVCGKQYVFNATPVYGTFRPRMACPNYRIPTAIAAAVREKSERDRYNFAALVNRGMRTVAVNTGSDGGMHPTFVAKLQPGTFIDTTGRPAAYARPGSGLPKLVRLPRHLDPDSTSAIGGRPRLTQVASADPSQPIPTAQRETSSGNFFANMFRFGRQPAESNKRTADTAATKRQAAARTTRSRSTSERYSAAPVPAVRPAPARSEPTRHVASVRNPSSSDQSSALPRDASAFAKASTPAQSGNPRPVMPGAQPVLAPGSFESRWYGMR